MKKKLLLLSALTIIGANYIFAQSYNFESWTGNEPNSWETSNAQTTQNGGATTVQKETIAPGQGTASVKMQTGNCPSCPNFSILGPFGPATPLPNPLGGSITKDVPIAQRPISVSFKYKAQPQGNDAGGFMVSLTKYDAITDDNITIGEAYFEVGVTTNNWTDITIPITYYSNLIPDTMSLWATSSIGSFPDLTSLGLPPLPFSPPTPVAGSTFLIDAININLPSCDGFSLNINGSNETSVGAMDGAISVAVVGGTAPYTYSWSNLATTNSISGLIPNLYSVSVTDGTGCVKVANYNVLPFTCGNFSVTVNGALATSFTAEDGYCNAVVSGLAGPYTYLWNNGATTANITGLRLGAYAVAVTASNGNCITWGYFPTSFSTAVKTIVSEDDLMSTYPNPTQGIFTISTKENYQYINITNIVGEIIYQAKMENQKSEIDLSKQAKGVYFVKIIDNENKYLLSKLVIE